MRRLILRLLLEERFPADLGADGGGCATCGSCCWTGIIACGCGPKVKKPAAGLGAESRSAEGTAAVVGVRAESSCRRIAHAGTRRAAARISC